MFSIWSMLNSSLADQRGFEERLRKYKDVLKLSMNDFYKPLATPQAAETNNPALKRNENELVRKMSTYLNLDTEICGELFIAYTKSPYNQFVISSDLLEKLHVEELFSAHFQRFVEYYYRERYSFVKNLILIISCLTDNTPVNYTDDNCLQINHLDAIKEIFKVNDLKTVYKSLLKDYGFLCKEIKLLPTKKSRDFPNADNFLFKNQLQFIKELELTLELMLIVTSLIDVDQAMFCELVKEFNKHTIIKHFNSTAFQYTNETAAIVDQISYTTSFITVKAIRLHKFNISEQQAKFTQDEKNQLLSLETRNLVNELITSFGSNQKASPIILAWATLLYNLSIDETLTKVFTAEMKTLTNRMFALSIKENVFTYLLNVFATNQFPNQEVSWFLKQTIFHLVNSVLHSFDENSMSQNLKTLFELCFFCMHNNQRLCEEFWAMCKQADRDNITILISYAFETFPVSFGLTLTFFSLITKTSADLCQQSIGHLARMNQFCEYFDNIGPEEYISNGETVKLLTPRKLFDGYTLGKGQKGTILGHLNDNDPNQNSIHRMMLQMPAVCWNLNFNCLDLVQNYLNRINYCAAQNNLSGEAPLIIPIIQLIDSLFKHIFEFDEQTCPNYDSYIKHMENFANSCFTLFTNLMNNESPDSYRLLAKLLDLFNNISSNVYDKLMALLQQNNLIGHSINYDKMNTQQLFNNRFNIVNSSHKQLFIFKSNDYELIIKYIRLINNLINENGNGIEYMSTMCCVLVHVFPQIHKWKSSVISLNIDLSLACLNFLHGVLNSSSSSPSSAPNATLNATESFYSSSGLQKTNVNSLVSIDQFCETLLLNTECSESLLHLIHAAYECTQDVTYSNEIKKLDNIIMQSISLINRLIVVPTVPAEELSTATTTHQPDISQQPVNQTTLYSLLVKSIKHHSHANSNFTASSSSCTASLASEENNLTNEIISKNNQFLLQLNLMMSQSNSNISKNISILNTTMDGKSEINWFYLLVKISIYKSNSILDCLLFSVFKKVSQLTPRLFGSLVGPFADQVQTIVLSKLQISNDGQTISTICEFLCSLVENQPGFFQTLACLKVEAAGSAATGTPTTNASASTSTASSANEQLSEKFIEGDRSVLKAMFNLLTELTIQKNKNNQDYYVSLAGILSVFYTIWSNKKLDFMNYCKQKSQFWPTLASTLKIIKKELNVNTKRTNLTINTSSLENQFNEDATIEYLDFFDFDNQAIENEYSQFDEFILEANLKSVSYSFKIFSIELFEVIYLKKNLQAYKEIQSFLTESIFGKNLIEKWLEFHVFQLKRDLSEEARSILNLLKMANLNEDQSQLSNANMSIIDVNTLSNKLNGNRTASSNQPKRKMKSKILFESIQMQLLLLNKTTRLAYNFVANNPNVKQQQQQTPQSANVGKINLLYEQINIKKLNLKAVFSSLIDAMSEMINHFLYLNNISMRFQQEIQMFQQEQTIKSESFFTISDNMSSTLAAASRKTSARNSNFLTLKQTNEIVKQFYTISNTLMILITSIKDNNSQTGSLDLKQLSVDLILVLEKLFHEDLNFFPAIINNVQTSLLHIFSLGNQTVMLALKSDEALLRKFVSILCKVFVNSENYLESEQRPKIVTDSIRTFVLNVNLFKCVMVQFNSQNWHSLLVENCIIQCLYTLFEKYIQNNENKELIYSITEMFYIFAQNMVEYLEKSDFNSRTCLLVSKLFNYSFNMETPVVKPGLEDDKLFRIKWSNVLCMYLNVQTILLKRLKYSYLKEATLFFGSYYETMIQVILNLQHSLNPDLLFIIRAICRYVSQICAYKRELAISITNSMENLERLFCSILQLCIMKLKMLTIKSYHQQHTSSQHQTQNAQALSKLTNDEILTSQTLLFSILSYCLDSLANFMPNFADGSYMTKLDEYRLLIAFQLTPPSSFDLQSPLSFGGILWLIDYILKIVHRHDHVHTTQSASAGSNMSRQLSVSSNLTVNKKLHEVLSEKQNTSTDQIVSPKKNVSTVTDESAGSEIKLPPKSLIVPVLEKTLNFLLAQILLCDRFSNFSARDKKLFKRELNSEINQIVHGLGKTFKKSTSSQFPTKSPTSNASANIQTASGLLSTSSKQTYDFFKCIQSLLQQTIE